MNELADKSLLLPLELVCRLAALFLAVLRLAAFCFLTLAVFCAACASVQPSCCTGGL